jgi:hypothetical protein
MGLFGGGGSDKGTKKAMYELQQGKQKYEKELRPIADIGMGGYREMQALLGLGGDVQGAQDRFMNAPGQQYSMQQMQQATQRQFAATGQSGSGNVLAALQERSQGLASQQFGQHMGYLTQLAQPGLTAKQNIADMEMGYAQQMGQLQIQKEASKGGGGGFDLMGAIGGGLAGFATGDWIGAAGGAIQGGTGSLN